METTAAAAPQRGRSSAVRAALAALLAVAITVLGLVVPTAATAETISSENGAYTWEVNYGGDYNGYPVVEPGVNYTATFGYNLQNVEPGSSVSITIPEGVTFPSDVPAGNENVKSIGIVGDQLVVTFVDEFSANLQGFIDFVFQVDQPESGSVITTIPWQIDGNVTDGTLIIKDPEDQFRPPAGQAFAKSGGANFWDKVTYNTQTDQVELAADITDVAIPYSLTMQTTGAKTVTLSDTISEYLSYDQGSFTAALVSWDENGLNRTESAIALSAGQPTFDGQSFTIEGFELPANSQIAVSYTARVSDTAALRDALQAEADAKADTTSDQGFGLNVGNTATIDGGSDQSLNIWFGSTRPAEAQPGPDGLFKKSADFADQYVVNPNGETEGNLPGFPITIPYTFTANLSGLVDTEDAWDAKWDLTQDVVLTDQLPEHVAWDEASLEANRALRALMAAPLNKAEFAAATEEGDYYFDEDTRTLMVNLGQTQDWTISVNGVIASEADLLAMTAENPGSNEPQIAARYPVKNTVTFTYWDGRDGDHTVTKRANKYLNLIQPEGSTIVDNSEFDKNIGNVPAAVSGQSVQVPFTFSVAAGAAVDLAASQIVDTVNHDVFNVTEENLDDIAATISGTYAGRAIGGSDFELTLVEGELVFQFLGGEGFGDAPYAGALNLAFTLPTHVVQGKQTIDLSNSARLVGETTNSYEWQNQATGTATSYGDELEVQKYVYGGNSEWTKNLRVEIDPETGLPVQNEFIYRVQLIPHGTFTNRSIFDINDILPEGTTLLGFVADDKLDEAENANHVESITIDGNLTVTADYDAGVVTIEQKPGTRIGDTQPRVNFKVAIESFKNVDEFVEDLGVTNRIGAVQATITGTDGYPLQILKTDSLNPDRVISDENARFTITGPGGDVITDEAFVENGQLVVAGENGEPTGLVIPENADGSVPSGTYTITENVAPKGYTQPEAGVTYTARIAADGSSSTLIIANDPKGYAIGDYTWIDANRNGTQDEGEEVLSGVGVALRDLDGNLVEHLNGSAVEDVTTVDGYYAFDNLPAGEYQIVFTLTGEQAAQYAFTRVDGGNDATNSDALVDSENPAVATTAKITLDDENENLTEQSGNGTVVAASEGIDPTWDAGVVKRSFAIGDYVWIDDNHDGIQDEDEKPLERVTVNLLVDGEVVGSVETDENGRYLFDNLDEGYYQVEFVLTEEHQKTYIFTRSNVEIDDLNADSDADFTTGRTEVFHLGPDTVTKDYDGQKYAATEGIDPTWDAGVVVKSYAIGDYTWIDTNRDGLQSDDEPVLANVTVELLDADGNSFDEPLVTTTDANGYYLFDKVPAGEYTLKFTLNGDDAVKYTFTDALQGEGATATDSDAKRGSGLTEKVTVGYGTVVKGEEFEAYKAAHPDTEIKATVGVDPTWDAGVVVKTYAVGDYTWIDTNRDGVQNDDEVLAGVTVKLLRTDGEPVTNINGEPVEPVVTDENGMYRFDNLPSGKYEVKFTLTPEQSELYVYTFPNSLKEGTGPNNDSDAIVSGDDQAVAITVSVTLDDSNEHLTLGVDGVKATEGIDPTWDAGVFARTYAIGDVVWVDDNNDGVQNDDEFLEGVIVELLDAEGNSFDEPITTTTDENGNYLFDELPAGNYRVKFTLTEEQAKKYNFTGKNVELGGDDSDADPATGITDVIELTHGAPNLTTDYKTADVKATDGIDPMWDAGVVHKTYAVGDYTWIDANRDGVQNEDEPVLPGVTVELIDAKSGKIVGTTTTDENGRYLFDNRRGGEYKIRFTLTDEQALVYSFTDTTQGGDAKADSDATRGSGFTKTFVLDGSNESLVPSEEYGAAEVQASEGIDPTWDAGVVVKRVSVGDYVWFDENKDGIQDKGEPGIEGVCLELVGPDGKPVVDVDGNEVKPTKTDKDGKYSFDNLPALPEGQHYTVKLSCAPEGYEPTKPGAGDRDKDSSTGSAESTDLTEDGQRDDTLDFGFVKKPVMEPTQEPTPTENPEPTPTKTPEPTKDPEPTTDPEPTEEPAPAPTELPSPTPTADPEPQPTEYPSPAPTEDPEPAPTEDPQPKPTEEPAPAPTDEAKPEPAPMPSENPAPAPTPAPSETPRGGLNPTGGDMALPLGALGATLLLGGVAVYAIRRRTQQ